MKLKNGIPTSLIIILFNVTPQLLREQDTFFLTLCSFYSQSTWDQNVKLCWF